MNRLIPLLILALTAVCYAQQRGANTLGDGPWTYTTSERATKIKVSVVAKGLSHPWSMVWLPNGDMLITERSGQLRILRNGVLDPQPVTGVPKVQAGGTSGLLDIALHPKFAQMAWYTSRTTRRSPRLRRQGPHPRQPLQEAVAARRHPCTPPHSHAVVSMAKRSSM